jgi:hypothetical protein
LNCHQAHITDDFRAVQPSLEHLPILAAFCFLHEISIWVPRSTEYTICLPRAVYVAGPLPEIEEGAALKIMIVGPPTTSPKPWAVRRYGGEGGILYFKFSIFAVSKGLLAISLKQHSLV